MPAQLQIPLDKKPTRQRSWRVMWLSLFLLICALIVWGLFRLWITRDTTSTFKPESTTISVRILKNPQTLRLLNEHLADQVLLPGGPWTYRDALAWSAREFTLHMDAQGAMSLTTDQSLPPEVQASASLFGFRVHERNGVWLLAPEQLSVSVPYTRIFLISVLPWIDGEYIEYPDGEVHRTPLNIDEKGITLFATGFAGDFSPNWILPKNTEILAAFALPADMFELPLLAGQLQSFSSNQKVINAVKQDGAYLVFAKDEQGMAVYLAIPTNQLSLDDLAVLGEDIINRVTLTRTVLTIEDGTEILEIRADSENVSSTIQAEEEFSLITLENTKGNRVRITKTNGLITISNRVISSEISDFSLQTDCLADAHSFLKPSALYTELRNFQVNLVPTKLFQEFPLFFKEIAFNTNKARLCW
ncbi:hypothetical protein IH979_02140 [Patescibacteria group bacterium]|nr:hypothetical protein [Patescibacteria group bacterium]